MELIRLAGGFLGYSQDPNPTGWSSCALGKGDTAVFPYQTQPSYTAAHADKAQLLPEATCTGIAWEIFLSYSF